MVYNRFVRQRVNPETSFRPQGEIQDSSAAKTPSSETELMHRAGRKGRFTTARHTNSFSDPKRVDA
jgi:hypothetical protein